SSTPMGSSSTIRHADRDTSIPRRADIQAVLSLRRPGRSVNMGAIQSMDGSEDVFGKHSAGHIQPDLPQHVAARLLEQADIITGDSAAIFPQSGGDDLPIDYCKRVGQLLTQLLAFAVRDGRVDARGGFVGDLYRVALERSLMAERVFTFVYLTERAALDELALSDSFDATSEAWPIVVQMIRRAALDVLRAAPGHPQLA